MGILKPEDKQEDHHAVLNQKNLNNHNSRNSHNNLSSLRNHDSHSNHINHNLYNQITNTVLHHPNNQEVFQIVHQPTTTMKTKIKINQKVKEPKENMVNRIQSLVEEVVVKADHKNLMYNGLDQVVMQKIDHHERTTVVVEMGIEITVKMTVETMEVKTKKMQEYKEKGQIQSKDHKLMEKEVVERAMILIKWRTYNLEVHLQ